MPSPPPAADPARARLLIITLVRLSALAVVAVGLLVAARGWLGADSRLAGGLLAVAGLAQLLLAPRALIKAWRTPR